MTPKREVTAEMKYVRNLGGFESLHINVGVTASAREDETIDQAFERVYKFVEDKLIEKMKAAEAELAANKEE